jgi:hypothetical protein
MNSISILGRRSQTVIKITILSSFEVSTNLEARMNKQIPGTWGYQRSYPPLSFSSLPFLDGCRSTPFRFRLIQERLNEGWYCTSELDGDPRIATTPNSDISRGPDRSRARCWSVLHRNKSEIPHDTTGPQPSSPPVTEGLTSHSDTTGSAAQASDFFSRPARVRPRRNATARSWPRQPLPSLASCAFVS